MERPLILLHFLGIFIHYYSITVSAPNEKNSAELLSSKFTYIFYLILVHTLKLHILSFPLNLMNIRIMILF